MAEAPDLNLAPGPGYRERGTIARILVSLISGAGGATASERPLTGDLDQITCPLEPFVSTISESESLTDDSDYGQGQRIQRQEPRDPIVVSARARIPMSLSPLAHI